MFRKTLFESKAKHKPMIFRKIQSADDELFKRILDLYRESFPENERKELKYLLKPDQSIGGIFALFEKKEFLGFLCTLDVSDISHIIYLSIKRDKRNQGFGAKAVNEFCAFKKGMRVIVDIEAETETAEDNPVRRKRKEFYLKNGFSETKVRYRWHGDDFEILSRGGGVTSKEFSAFWDEIERVDEDLLY